MGKCIGIDLGTTNSVMCLMHTQPEIILNREAERLTPSVVYLKRTKKAGDAVMVGKLAADYAKAASKDYLYSIKRLMGRGYDDEKVQKVASRVVYEICPSPEGSEDVVRVRMGEKLYTPTEISSMILKKLKEDAQMRLSEKIESAVITVPAYFSERQKHATREAGLMAGLKVKKVIDEPTAAAIAYGIDQQSDKDHMVLVFDLGGGTFDVSILLMLGGTFAQMNNEGDMWLGGDDFDRLIMDKAIQYAEKEEGLADLDKNNKFMHALKKRASEAKEILSSQESAEIIISDVLKDETGVPIVLEYEITRSEFERLLLPFVDKALELVKLSLKNANLEKEDIDTVLLVGGSSSIPKFQDAIETFFGKDKVSRSIDPMTCVAQGAAILAKSLAEKVWCVCGHENSWEAERCEKCEEDLAPVKAPVKDLESRGGITSKTYGIEIEGDRFVEIIPKGTNYPTEEPYIEEFKTSMADQRIVKIPVREGFSEKASENEFMGNMWFYGLPGGLPDGTPIEVSMALDSDMVFTIGCRIKEVDWQRKMPLQHDGWQNPALDEAMNAHLDIKKQGITGSVADEMEHHIERIQKAVEENDERAAKNHREQLAQNREKMTAKEGTAASALGDWKIGLTNVVAISEANLNRVRPVLPAGDAKVLELEQWIREAKTAIETDDDVKGSELLQRGVKTLLNTPLVGNLVLASVAANSPGMDPALSTRLEQAKQDLLLAIDRKDLAELKSAAESFNKLLGEATAKMTDIVGRPVDISDLLTR